VRLVFSVEKSSVDETWVGGCVVFWGVVCWFFCGVVVCVYMKRWVGGLFTM